MSKLKNIKCNTPVSASYPQPYYPNLNRTTEDEANKYVKMYQKTGNKKDLLPVFDFLNTQINKRVSQFKAATLDDTVLKDQARQILAGEFKKFNPDKSSIRTFAHDRLRRLQRFVTTYQNPVRMPENITVKIGLYRETYDNMRGKLGRDPSTAEVSDALQWTPRQVSSMESYLNRIRNIMPDDTDTLQVYDPETDKIELSYLSMGPQNQFLFDNLTGSHGKKKISASKFSVKNKIPYSQIRKSKKEIQELLRGVR